MSCCYQPSHLCSLPESHKSRTRTQSKHFTRTYFRAPLIHLTQLHCFLTLLPLPATPFQKQDPFPGKQWWGPTSRNASWPFRDLPGSGARVGQTGFPVAQLCPGLGMGLSPTVPRFQPKWEESLKVLRRGRTPRVEGVGYSPLPQGESTCENPQYANAPRKKPNSKKWQFDPTLQNTSGLTERLDWV